MKSERPVLQGYFLVGPTAIGKSAVAQWIAETQGYDILSADSMAVYRGMDIGTAKLRGKESSVVRYYGIDLISPAQPFSVWDYRQYAFTTLAAIAAEGRKVIVVGGSGLYIKSLTNGLSLIPGANIEQRKRWTAIAETEGVEALGKALQQLNPALYESLADKQNPRRLIRALEQATAPASEPTTWKKESPAAALAGLMTPSGDLKLRVELRVAAMYRDGLVDEVRRLLSEYRDLSATAQQAIGYAEAMNLLRGRCSMEDAVARTVTRTMQLAKRQKTWFRHQANVEWISVDSAMNVPVVAEKVLAVWRRYGPTTIAE